MMQNSCNLALIKKMDRFSSALSTVKSLDRLTKVIEELIDDVVKVEQTGLYLYDFDEGRLKLYYARGFSQEEKEIAEKTAMETHPGKVFRTRTLLYIPDVQSDPDNLSNENPSSFTARSRLYIPIMNGSECVGAFGIVSTVSHRFTEEHLAILTFIAKIAGAVYKEIYSGKQLQKTETRLRLHDRALESISNGVVISDATLEYNPILYVNKAFEQITGYSSEEVLGQNCRFLQRDDNSQDALTTLRETIKQKKSCTVLLRNYRKNGELFYNQLSISPITDSEGLTTHFIGIQSDVTDRVKREETRVEMASRLTALISNLDEGILLEDSNRKIVLVNSEFCRLFGIQADPAQLIGYDCEEAGEQAKYLFKDETGFLSRIRKILTERKHIKNEELELKNNRTYLRSFVPIFHEERYFGHLWQYRDITNEKAHAVEIRRLKAFYEHILYDLPAQIAVFDTDFKYLFVNTSSISKSEIREWIIGKDDYEYCAYRGVPIEIAHQRREKLLQAYNEKNDIRFEEEFRRADGETLHFLRVLSPVFNENGNITRILAYGFDITKRKLADIEVENSKNQLQAVLDTAAEAIVTADENGVITMANREAELMWGYSKDELTGSGVDILMPRKYRQMHIDGMKRYIESGVIHVLNKKLELEGLRKNGSEFPIEMTIKETIISGRKYFTAAVHDLSELKILLKKLEQSNKALSEFAYIASHDLREPLRKITAFGKLLAESVSEKLSIDERENLEFMIDGAGRMENMINDLLSYSRISAEVIDSEPVNVDSIINDLVRFELSSIIEERAAKIIIENEIGNIFMEVLHVRQLFQNVISNGIKYCRKNVNPEIRIRTYLLSNYKIFEIEDNGIGIEEKYHDQIFMMFKRLNLSKDVSGSGIGLAICKKITELYGGGIHVRSNELYGSTFIIKLPLKL